MTQHLVTSGETNPVCGPDVCGWCQRPIGTPHAEDCVRVKRTVVYAVLRNGRQIGTYVTTEPADWDVRDGEFHKNDGSWCSDNCDEDTTWTERPEDLDPDGCWCSILRFKCLRRLEDVKVR